eukprot:scaffold3337_cov95-Cylindrotheca_fusiformis.AAC.3
MKISNNIVFHDRDGRKMIRLHNVTLLIIALVFVCISMQSLPFLEEPSANRKRMGDSLNPENQSATENAVPVMTASPTESQERPELRVAPLVDPDDESELDDDSSDTSSRSRSKAGIVKFFNPDDKDESEGEKASIRSRASTTNSSPEVCFVSSSYARSSSVMDRLVRIENESPYLKFYMFTNLNDDEWSTPGFTKIVTNFNYRRRITHSRHGKFLAWQYPQLMECGAIIYMDACIQPTRKQQVWRDLAAKLADSDVGLMQYINPLNRTSISDELAAIQRGAKDIPENVENTLKWMISQPDFADTIPIYWNEQFGYNPKSKVFQRLSKAFWDVYSEEVLSWRDQPLWAFMLHRYNVTPMLWPKDIQLWRRKKEDYGHNGHTYTSEADVLADWLHPS